MSTPTGERRRPHEWVGATVLVLDSRLADQAHKNGKLTVISRLTVDVIDVYCKVCRRQYGARAVAEPCSIGPQHIGGPRRQPEPLALEGVDWPPPHDPLG